MQQCTRKIYVVLTKSPTPFGWAVRKIKGDTYTHAVLSLDKELHYMFSFGSKSCYKPYAAGFKRESFRKEPFFRKRKVPGVVLELPVTERQYDDVIKELSNFLRNPNQYSYNYLGLFAILFGKDLEREHKYFCSEFVYHILHRSGICDFNKPRGFVRPQDLLEVSDVRTFGDDLKERELPETENDYLSHLYPETVPAKLDRRFIRAVCGRLMAYITQESTSHLKTNIILKTSYTES